MVRAVAAEYPTVTSVRVRDALETVNRLLAKVFTAIRAAGGLTLISGVLVLAGALSTVRARRIYEAVILKTLGATRWRILSAHMAEYLILGLATAIVASAAGALVAYVLLTQIMEIRASSRGPPYCRRVFLRPYSWWHSAFSARCGCSAQRRHPICVPNRRDVLRR